MPPTRKKLKVEEEQKIKTEEEHSSVSSADSRDWEEASSDSAYSRYAVLRARPDVDRMFDQVGRFEALPTTTLVALVTGVCVRLQNALAPLTDSSATATTVGSARDRARYERFLNAVKAPLTDAVTDLMAAEIVFGERVQPREH